MQRRAGVVFPCLQSAHASQNVASVCVPSASKLEQSHHCKCDSQVDCEVGKPKVNFREAIQARAEFNYLHKKQSGGAGECFALLVALCTLCVCEGMPGIMCVTHFMHPSACQREPILQLSPVCFQQLTGQFGRVAGYIEPLEDSTSESNFKFVNQVHFSCLRTPLQCRPCSFLVTALLYLK